MARDFSGSSSANLAKSGISTAAGSYSVGAFAFQSALAGPSNFADIVNYNQSGVGDILELGLWDDGTVGNQRMEWKVGHATQDKQILSTRPLVATGLWQIWVVVDDGSLTAGTNKIYYGTQSISMTDQSGSVTAAGSGAQRTGSSADCKIGNYWGTNNNFPGVLAHVFIVPWQMTLSEAEQYRTGDFSCLSAHGTPVFYLPLDGSNVTDALGPTGTWSITGTTVAADPVFPSATTPPPVYTGSTGSGVSDRRLRRAA